MSERSITDRQLQTTCLVILTMIAIGAALYFLRPVVVPFLLAVVVVYALQPMIDWQERRLRWPRWLAVAGAGLAALLVLVAIGLLVTAFIVKLREHLPEYQAQLRQLSDRMAERFDFQRWGIDVENWKEIPEFGTRQLLGAILSSGVELLSSGSLVILFVVFMLSGSAKHRKQSALRGQIDTSVRSYILSMIGLSVLTGVLVGGTLAWLGIDFALEFGVLAFLLNFIPTIGSLIATLLPLPVVILSPDLSMTARILAIALPTANQMVLGNFVQPRVVGKSQDLHPVAVLMAMVFFGTIWGVVGAVLAAPIAGVMRIIFSQIDATKPFAEALSGGVGDADEPIRSTRAS